MFAGRRRLRRIRRNDCAGDVARFSEAFRLLLCMDHAVRLMLGCSHAALRPWLAPATRSHIRSRSASTPAPKDCSAMTVDSKPEHAGDPCRWPEHSRHSGAQTPARRCHRRSDNRDHVHDRLRDRLWHDRFDLRCVGRRHGAVLLRSRSVRHGAVCRRWCADAAHGVAVQLYRAGGRALGWSSCCTTCIAKRGPC